VAEKHKIAFFAYPGEPRDLVNPITTAVEALKISNTKTELTTWPQMSVFGANIPDEVRINIDDTDILVCDITRPNLNVYYEIGYAIGRGKAIAPVLNSSFASAEVELQRQGIFDNIGYSRYENSHQLLNILTKLPTNNLAELYSKRVNHSQPLYVLDTYRKTDFRNAIVSSIKSIKGAFYRSFDPVEVPRFSIVSLIGEVSSSVGIIIPRLSNYIDDAERHNQRAAILAGLGHGFGRDTLLIQMLGADQKSDPADYRDFISSVRDEKDIAALVGDFATKAIVSGATIELPRKKYSRSPLQQLSLGAPAAENEFRSLSNYFVETAEFLKAVRGEAHIVAGRKGSGKTAIFFQVRDSFREDRNNVVVDLKPESHQLSLFREELLKTADVGVYDHTFAAFWNYLILSEILLIISGNYEVRSKHDGRYLSALKEIDRALGINQDSESGDFTSRLNRLSSHLLQEIRRIQSEGGKLNVDRITSIIYQGGVGQVKEIRSLICKYTKENSNIVFLFDNLDKGWPASGVHMFDVRLVRLLMETLDKVRKDFNGLHRHFISIVFLRNDIYELLVGETPDRGKSAQVYIDWTDRTKLRQLVYLRIKSSIEERDLTFDEVWGRFFVPDVGSRKSFDFFVDHCLMRPRFLLNIIENSIAHAINRGHIRVEAEDCVDAVKQHSNYLVSDFGYEIRDVSGLNTDVLYAFIGVTKFLTKNEVIDCLKNYGLTGEIPEKALELLLWYGVLGIGNRKGEESFIYDYEYNMKRLIAEIKSIGDDHLYVVNPAFHIALA